jgi:hypothetical protein
MPVVISTMSIYGLFSIKVANISCCCSIMENALNGAKKNVQNFGKWINIKAVF